MQILSATEAISPAFARTKLILYSPFRVGRTWKLSATAYLSIVGTMFLPFTLIYAAVGLVIPALPHVFRVLIVAVSLALTAIYIVMFWLCGRLKFAFFDIVLNRGEFVAPAWRKYGERARQWTLTKMLLGSVFTLALAIPAYAVFRTFISALPALQAQMSAMDKNSGFPPGMANFMAAFYGAYFVATFVVAAYFIAISTISSFVVPTMALENASVGDAFRRFTAFARRETKQLAAFVGVRIGLAIVGYIATTLAYEIVLFLLMAVAAIVCGVIGLLLHLAGVPMTVLLVLGVIVIIFFVFIVNGYLLLLALGPFFTFFEAHTLYFLGGRYPLLGELLDRSTPAPVFKAPQSPLYAAPYYPPPTH